MINWGHGRFAVGLEINLYVSGDSDPEVVRRLIISVVQANPLILRVPGIVARLEDIQDNSFYYLVRAFISARRVKEQWEIAAALRAEMVKAFREHNIEFTMPTRVVQFDTKQIAIPGEPKSIEIKFDK